MIVIRPLVTVVLIAANPKVVVLRHWRAASTSLRPAASGNLLTKVTAPALAICFFATSLGLSLMARYGAQPTDIFDPACREPGQEEGPCPARGGVPTNWAAATRRRRRANRPRPDSRRCRAAVGPGAKKAEVLCRGAGDRPFIFGPIAV